MDLFKELCHITGEENVLRDEPMSRHTTFRIGGPADFFVTAGKERADRTGDSALPQQRDSLLYSRERK